MTGNDFHWKHSEGGFKSDHEQATPIVKHVLSFEDVLLEDIAYVRSEQPDVDLFRAESEVFGQSVRIIQKNYEVKSVFIASVKVLTIGVQVGPCLKHQIFRFIAVFLLILRILQLHLIVKQWVIWIETPEFNHTCKFIL